MKYTSSQSGFTLIELAIVLMIIGLLIGGILKGQELINNARVTSTLRQIKSYEAAFLTFQDSYGALPGDISGATTRIPNCTAGNSCSGGNGNGIIGDTGTYVWNDLDVAITAEINQAWKHLALANLISGIDTSANTMGFGTSNPSTLNDGAMFIRYSLAVDSSYAGRAGHHLALRNNITGAWGNSTGSRTVSPTNASQIDRKIDDGVALRGSVISMSHGNFSGCGRSNLGGQDAEGYGPQTNPLCDMFFEMP